MSEWREVTLGELCDVSPCSEPQTIAEIIARDTKPQRNGISASIPARSNVSSTGAITTAPKKSRKLVFIPGGVNSYSGIPIHITTPIAMPANVSDPPVAST